MELKRTGMGIEDEDEFYDHARDAIWGRKIPQRKLLREQLQAMRNRRRSLNRNKISVHYLQYEGKHHIAVNSLEHRSDLAKVRSIGRFDRISAGFWKPATDRASVSKFIRILHDEGYRVAYWDEFVQQAKEWYSLDPQFNLSIPEDLRSKLPGAAPLPPKPLLENVTPKKGMSKGKIKTLQAVNVSSELDYSGKGPFNIAVIQSLINKEYMIGEKDSTNKKYINCSLTNKGREALGMEVIPDSLVVPDPVDETSVPLTNGTEEIQEVLEDAGISQEDLTNVKEDVESGIEEVIANATGSGWSVTLIDLDDEFEPQVKWTNDSKSQQIRMSSDDSVWNIRQIRRKDGKNQARSFTFASMEEAITKASTLMSGSVTSKDRDINSININDFKAEAKKRTQTGIVWELTRNINDKRQKSRLSNKKSDDPRPRFQPLILIQKPGQDVEWEKFGNSTVIPKNVQKDFDSFIINTGIDQYGSDTKFRLLIVPIDISKVQS